MSMAQITDRHVIHLSIYIYNYLHICVYIMCIYIYIKFICWFYLCLWHTMAICKENTYLCQAVPRDTCAVLLAQSGNGDLEKFCGIQTGWGPSSLAKLVNITIITISNYMYIYRDFIHIVLQLYLDGVINQLIIGGTSQNQIDFKRQRFIVAPSPKNVQIVHHYFSRISPYLFWVTIWFLLLYIAPPKRQKRVFGWQFDYMYFFDFIPRLPPFFLFFGYYIIIVLPE